MKILGPNGKIPEFPRTILATEEAVKNAWSEFDKARKDFKEKFDAYQTSFDKSEGTRTAFKDDVEGGNLGLNPKDKTENHKIVAA
jgi:hypothetical protein